MCDEGQVRSFSESSASLVLLDKRWDPKLTGNIHASFFRTRAYYKCKRTPSLLH